MSDFVTMPEWATALVNDARVAHLSTVSADGVPHVIPICFALIDSRINIAIDEKPKSGCRLQRLLNIEQNPRAAVVVDQYDEDWTKLAWVLVRGPARILTPRDTDHRIAIHALREKYPQYREMRLEDAEVIELSSERVTWWRGLRSSGAPDGSRSS